MKLRHRIGAGLAQILVGGFIGLCTLLGLGGCDEGKPLTNTQVIVLSKQCRDAGLVPVEFPGWTFRTVGIQCQNPIHN